MRTQAQIERTRIALQRVADALLPTSDPFLKPAVYYAAEMEGFEIALVFQFVAQHYITNLEDAAEVRTALPAMKSQMIAMIRKRLEDWEHESPIPEDVTIEVEEV